MRRRRLNPITGLFFNTGDRHVPTVDESFGFSRQYADTVTEGLMEGERLEQKKEELHRQEEERNRQMQNPVNKPLNNPTQNQMHKPDSHQNCL